MNYILRAIRITVWIRAAIVEMQFVWNVIQTNNNMIQVAKGRFQEK